MAGAYQKSAYECYVLISDHTRIIRGTYSGFVKFQILMSALNSMVSKQSNTYTYNGESYVSSLTNSEINNIQSAFDYGTYNSSVEKLKYIYIDVADRIF
jgi:hypothetical protein|tara:strand:- start:58 stop:354 length:297 start_codon:yes stop_codon:yes gene_type:complete